MSSDFKNHGVYMILMMLPVYWLTTQSCIFCLNLLVVS